MDNDGKKEIAPQDSVKPIQLNTGEMGRPALNITKKQINYAIQSTQSMKKAADYLNVSYKTFKNTLKFTHYGHHCQAIKVFAVILSLIPLVNTI